VGGLHPRSGLFLAFRTPCPPSVPPGSGSGGGARLPAPPVGSAATGPTQNTPLPTGHVLSYLQGVHSEAHAGFITTRFCPSFLSTMCPPGLLLSSTPKGTLPANGTPLWPPGGHADLPAPLSSNHLPYPSPIPQTRAALTFTHFPTSLCALTVSYPPHFGPLAFLLDFSTSLGVFPAFPSSEGDRSSLTYSRRASACRHLRTSDN